MRCWTVQAGALAPQAAGVIHSDFERGFIKAETVSFDDFKANSTGPSMAEAFPLPHFPFFRLSSSSPFVASAAVCRQPR